jgi:hypothetical protein
MIKNFYMISFSIKADWRNWYCVKCGLMVLQNSIIEYTWALFLGPLTILKVKKWLVMT